MSFTIMIQYNMWTTTYIPSFGETQEKSTKNNGVRLGDADCHFTLSYKPPQCWTSRSDNVNRASSKKKQRSGSEVPKLDTMFNQLHQISTLICYKGLFHRSTAAGISVIPPISHETLGTIKGEVQPCVSCCLLDKADQSALLRWVNNPTSHTFLLTRWEVALKCSSEL